MKKGITPIVATIMLLLIVLSLLGGLFVWMNRTVGGLQGLVGNQTENQAEQMSQTIAIENIDVLNDNITVRNTGTVNIPSGSVSVYVDGSSTDCSPDNDIAPGSTETISCSTTTISNGNTVRVTAPGNEDQDVA